MEAIEENRQLIPRWHLSQNLAKLNIAAKPIKAIIHTEMDKEQFEKSKNSWLKEKSFSNAIDLSVKAKILGMEDEALDARDYLISNQSQLTTSVKKYVIGINEEEHNIQDNAPESIYKAIAILKKLRNKNPNDSLIWNDLSFHYATLGLTEKAVKHMQIAFDLSNRNPILARGFSRLLIHCEDPERAVYVLKKTDQIKTNPLILSADISIKTSFNIKNLDINIGKKLIASYKGNERLLSELSASIGSIEMNNGSTKLAKQYISRSLIAPTENTITQLYWLKHRKNFRFTELIPQVATLEAKMIECYSIGKYKECKNLLLELHNFQPFSDRVLADASYLSLVALNNPLEAIRIYNEYFYITKKSFMITNNTIVAFLELGNIERAEELLIKAASLKRNEREMATLNATFAMYQYKIGNPDAGKRIYESAVEFFEEKCDKDDLGRLYYYFGIQELKVNDSNGKKLLDKAKLNLKDAITGKEILIKMDQLGKETKNL